MSEPHPSRSAADRNLLFGTLALQLDFVVRDELVAAMNAWALDKQKSLGQILVDRGTLSDGHRELLDSLVEAHLRIHGNDSRSSLEAVAAHSTVTDALNAVTDPDVQSTLSEVDTRAVVAQRTPGRNGTRYRRLRAHARGGLGQVFVAEDTELHREVAVKEIQPERDNPSSRNRFLLEAEITGALEHPGIIPVYGLGVYPDGRPYYAMRLVRGDSLKQAIDQFHAQDWSARPVVERVSALRPLLRRLIDTCNAVAYAHSRGVLHRDLKPQNVMLGKFGETLVLDWGLAKVGIEAKKHDPAGDRTTDPLIRPSSGSDHGGTAAGSLMGTPGYMSPEQADGRHDELSPASDVYSLGVTLHVLLTGRKLDDLSETIAATGVARPVADGPPSDGWVPAPLLAIGRKAMAERPSDRYPSPLDLAADLERWLADEPVPVHPDPWTVRAIRWARRHRTAVAAGIVFLVTATLGLALGTALLWREERRTRHEYDRAEREQLAAQRNFETARTTILEMGSRIEAIETGMTDTRRSDLKRKAALDAARTEFERFADENPDDLVLKKQLAALHRYAANIARLLGDYGEADAAYKASLALWDDLIRREPNDISHRDNLALTLADSAAAQKRGGRLRDAATTLDRAATAAEEIKDHVPLPSYQRTLALALVNRADVEYRLGNFEAAEQAAARAVELYDALKEAPPEHANPIDPLFAIIAVNTRGTARREMGKLREALESFNDAVARAEALGGAKGSRDVRHQFNKARLERATTRVRTGDGMADALAECGKVIESAEKLVADFPHTPGYQDALTTALMLRGEITTRSAPAAAAADYDRALAITRELVDKYSQQADHIGLRGLAYFGKGRLLLSQGKKSEAGTLFDLAVTVFKIALKKDPDNFQLRRGLGESEEAVRANPKPAK